jgi:hypothetical protein
MGINPALLAQASLTALHSGMSVDTCAVPLPRVHPGPQTTLVKSDADIIIYGGKPGGGKTWVGFRCFLRGMSHPRYAAVFFRIASTHATAPGGAWSEADTMYAPYGAKPRRNDLTFTWPSGASVKVAHLRTSDDARSWDGPSLDDIVFDEAIQFPEDVFWYVVTTRARTNVPGFKCRVYCMTNPTYPDDPKGGWLSKLVINGGWVNGETGLYIPEMSGVKRWFYRNSNDEVLFYDSAEQCIDENGLSPDFCVRTMTFIHASPLDNPTLMGRNPGYNDQLSQLPGFERKRLFDGNWLASPQNAGVFDSSHFEVIDNDPSGGKYDEHFEVVQEAWDFGATEKGDATAWARIGIEKTGRVVILGSCEFKGNPGATKKFFLNKLFNAPKCAQTYIPTDPGQAGVFQASDLIESARERAAKNKMPAPWLYTDHPTGSKLHRAMPLARAVASASSSDAHGNVAVVKDGNERRLLSVMHGFHGNPGGVDDLVDAASDAYRMAVDRYRSAVGRHDSTHDNAQPGEN